MYELIKKLLAYIKTTSYKNLFEKYHEKLLVYVGIMGMIKKNNPSYRANLKKLADDIMDLCSEISREIGNYYWDLKGEESPIAIKIDRAYMSFCKIIHKKTISEQEEEIKFLIKTILKLIGGMTEMEDKTRVPKKTSKTPNLVRIKAHLDHYEKFVEEHGHKPNHFSTNSEERKLSTNIYSVYRKIDRLPECMQEKLREIFPKTDVIGKCDEYIKFVKENKRIPTKITDDPVEKKLASFRNHQMINLNRRKKPLPEDEFDKLKIVINHYDLLAKVITLTKNE